MNLKLINIFFNIIIYNKLMFFVDEISDNIYYMKLSKLNKNEFDTYKKSLIDIFLKKINFKIIFDLSDICIEDFLYSKEQLELMNSNKNNTEKYLDKSSVIIKSDIIKNIVNSTILSIYKPRKPNILTTSYEDALLFLQK